MTDLEITGQTSLSLFGAKRLAYRADPKKFIHFSDAGGPLTEAYKTNISFASFCKICTVLIVVPPGPTLAGGITLTGDKVVKFSCSEGLALLELILGWSKHTLLPRIVFPAKVSAAELSNFQDLANDDDDTGEDLFPVDAINELFSLGFLPVRLEVENDRLCVRTLNYSTELPIGSTSLSLSGSTLQCNNRLLIGDKPFSGFTIDFPTRKVATRYLDVIGLSSVLARGQEVTVNHREALVGLIGEVGIQGNLRGRKLEPMTRDARIEDKMLRILDGRGVEIPSIDFESPSLAINGTANEFIVSPNSSVALRITSESKPFAHAIYTNDAVNAAVIRSSDVGPFIARDPEGQFIRIECTGDGATIGYAGDEPTAVPAGVEQPILRTTDGKSNLHVGGHTMEAELPMLEGICATLTGISLQPVVSNDFQNAIAQLLALEGKFLTHCVFGKLAAVHIALMTELKWDVQSSCLLLRRDEDKQTFLGVMAETARELSIECETVMNYLPGYITEHDRNFLSDAGLANSLDYATAETGYQAAVNGAGAFLSHFGRIEGRTSQFQSSRDFAARKEGWAAYAPLGASVAAGLLVNPVFVFGAIQQGLALKRGKDAKESIAVETVQNSFGPCAREWDFIIRTLLPAISNRFVKQIYPLRLAIAHTLRKAYATGGENVKTVLHRVVARRLGRLTTFLDFPVSSDLGIKRHEYVDFVWGKQSHAEGIHERRF